MSRKKNLKTAATTFSVALGIGFVMQYGDAVASKLQPDAQDTAVVAMTPEMVIPTQITAASSIAVPEILTPTPDEGVIELAALDTTLNDVEVPEIEAPTVLKWSGKFGQRAKMYPTRTNGYENDEATELFRQF